MEFLCETCGKGFTTSRSRARHRRQVHQGEHQTCHWCGKRYSQKSKLQEHLKKCAGLVCPTCGQEFEDLLRLNRHKVNDCILFHTIVCTLVYLCTVFMYFFLIVTGDAASRDSITQYGHEEEERSPKTWSSSPKTSPIFCGSHGCGPHPAKSRHDPWRWRGPWHLHPALGEHQDPSHFRAAYTRQIQLSVSQFYLFFQHVFSPKLVFHMVLYWFLYLSG